MAAILNSVILDSAILHKTLTQTSSIWLKLILSDSAWWRKPSWILQCWIQPFCTKLRIKLVQSDSTSFIVTQLPAGSHLEFCHLGFSHFAHNSESNYSIWLKLIHFHSTWWWQPFWILPSWFKTLPSWIQTPCYLLSDSFKNTLPPLWPWLKLIQSD